MLTNKFVILTILFLQCQSYNNCAFHNSTGYSNISLFIKDGANIIIYIYIYITNYIRAMITETNKGNLAFCIGDNILL